MLPIVTCICPTANRREFLRRAIDLFMAQDYPNKNLIIVEDGDDDCSDVVRKLFVQPLSPSYPSDTVGEIGKIGHGCIVLHEKLSGQRTIGAKRNWACKRAPYLRHAPDGLIAHWDDDDWHSPKRLSVQVAAMEKSKARICGMDRLVFYDGTKAWLYQGATQLHGGTLMYERSLWASQPFEDRSSGEDTMFVRAALASGVKAVQISDERLYVARVHPGNTDNKVPDHQWGKYDERRVRRWMGEASP